MLECATVPAILFMKGVRKYNADILYVEGGCEAMTTIIVREGEPFEKALKRFKQSCQQAGLISEIKKREHYEKPSVRKKKKSEKARKRLTKKDRFRY